MDRCLCTYLATVGVLSLVLLRKSFTGLKVPARKGLTLLWATVKAQRQGLHPASLPEWEMDCGWEHPHLLSS